MIASEVALILGVAFLCVTLAFAVFTLCKRLLNEKTELMNIDMLPINKRTIIFDICPNKDKIPTFIRPVKTQLPLEDFRRESSHLIEQERTNSIGRKRAHLIGRDKTQSIERERAHSCLQETTDKERTSSFGRERSPTIVLADGMSLSLSSERSDSTSHEKKIGKRERSSSQLEIKQRRISHGAIEHLRKQDKQVCTSDLRSHSDVSSEDDNLPWQIDLQDDDEIFSTDSFLSDSDQSGSSSSIAGDIEFNSEYLNGIKTRIASKRGNNQTYLLKKKKIGTIAMKTNFQSGSQPSSNSLDVWISRVILDYFNEKKDSSLSVHLCIEKTQMQTSKCKGTSEFNFNEQFCFNNIDLTQVHLYNLKIKLFKYKKLGRKNIGEALIHITDLNRSSEESNIYFDLFWHFKSKASLASLNISICYHATIAKLDVIVNQAKRLPKNSNPYVTVSLFREKTIEMKNTSIKYNSRDPVFDEKIEFDISTDVSNPLSVFTMVATVNNSSRIVKDRVIGHVIFSLSSSQKSAATHWNLVQNSPHQLHSDWHTLLDPNEI